MKWDYKTIIIIIISYNNITASFLQATAGSQRAPKEKYSQLKERVKRAIDNNTMGDHIV